MKKCRFEPYQKRLESQLPPIAMHQMDYLKQKYGHQIRRILFYLFERERDLEQEEILHDLFKDLFYNDKRYLLRTIFDFENWVVHYLFRKRKEDEIKTKFPHCIVQEFLIGGRIYRSREFDMIAGKYFEVCVRRVAKVGIAKPLEVVRIAFENAENVYLEIDENEENYLRDVERVINCYCMHEKCGMLKEGELEQIAF